MIGETRDYISKSPPAGKEAYSNLKNGIAKALSIGFELAAHAFDGASMVPSRDQSSVNASFRHFTIWFSEAALPRTLLVSL